MPPPRRRRPVQPATRVRLPRTARPGGAPATGEDTGEDLLTPDTLTGHELAADDLPAGQDTAHAPAAADVTTDGVAADDLTEEPADAAPADEREPEPDQPEPDEAQPAEAARPEGDGRDAAPRRGIRWPAALAGVAVILGGLAVWFAVEAGNTGSGVDQQNVALLNSAATTQVNRQITSAVNTVFSYNYADTAKTRLAAQAVLTGKAIQQYNTLFKLVQQDAPTEKLVLTTTVTNSGVSMLSGDRAQVLIFANQQDTGGSTRSTTDAGAMFSVDAVLQGGKWKIDNIDTFSAGA